MLYKLAGELKSLERAELARALSEPDSAYLFKDVLIQDTAYSSLLKNERRQLHRMVGETIEQLYADNLDDNAALLARRPEQAVLDTAKAGPTKDRVSAATITVKQAAAARG